MAYPLRWVFVAVEGVVGVGAVVGAAQLIAGIATPPDSALPFGWSDWTLPAVWLLCSVGVPAAGSAVLATRRSRLTPAAVLGASGMLGVELLVQIPFLGPSWLQLGCGIVAATMALAAWRARASGW